MSINTYPTLGTEGSVIGWSESRQSDTVLTAPLKSGRPFKSTNRILDSITFKHVIPLLTDAEHVTLQAFYTANKEKEFYWTHPGTLTVHLVSFDSPPDFRANGEKNSWSALQNLTTTAA